ncbi:SHOCT domain-containing protein [Micropruina sp.]|uniref:SHOCT domain-containing protein n=1 Tax=Micropruina sp. TaxID=2737536 RepID=UPI0039E666C1
MLSFLSNVWDFVWMFFTIFVFFAWLMALFTIITDLFRDRELSGLAKAIWLLFLIFVPFLTALVYLIARGRGMAERASSQMQAQKAATDDYIRSVSGGAAGEIAQAKALLDAGTITAQEFDALKAKSLG